MVSRPIQTDPCVYDAGYRNGEVAPRGISDCNVVQASVAARRWRATAALPCIEPDVVMISACRNERRLAAITLSDIKPQHVMVERECAIDVRHLQMRVPDINTRRNHVIRAGACQTPSQSDG